MEVKENSLSGKPIDRYEMGLFAWRSCTFLPLATMGNRGTHEVLKLEMLV
jgi:hypothetical protein